MWPKTDVIIGNPPFIGAKKLKPQRGADYARKVRTAYDEVPGMADYCVYWLRKAHQTLPECTTTEPFSGRAGLVGTQNIRNSQHRVGGLAHIAESGTIVDAVDSQPWSGEANVSVSIVNWVKTQSPELIPKKKRLWFQARPASGATAQMRRKKASKTYDLDSTLFDHINSALSGGTDTSGAIELACNTKPQRVFKELLPATLHLCFDLLSEPTLSRRMPGPHK